MQLRTHRSQTYTLPNVRERETIAPDVCCSDVLLPFSSIHLDEMTSVSLLHRIDTKYVLSEAQLMQALTHLTKDYAVLEIAGKRLHHYQTLYFDTPDFALYQQHHNGWRNRYKVRTRTYMDSDVHYLEIKHKTNRGITIKTRLQTPTPLTEVDAVLTNFVAKHAPEVPLNLTPSLWNRFQRITLVSKHSVERLTLDIGLQVWWGNALVTLPGVAVAEVKQEGYSLRSDFVGQMRAMGVRAMGFSKYCMGVSHLHQQVKRNNFKPQWLYIDKIMHKGGLASWMTL